MLIGKSKINGTRHARVRVGKSQETQLTSMMRACFSTFCSCGCVFLSYKPYKRYYHSIIGLISTPHRLGLIWMIIFLDQIGDSFLTTVLTPIDQQVNTVAYWAEISPSRQRGRVVWGAVITATRIEGSWFNPRPRHAQTSSKLSG